MKRAMIILPYEEIAKAINLPPGTEILGTLNSEKYKLRNSILFVVSGENIPEIEAGSEMPWLPIESIKNYMEG